MIVVRIIMQVIPEKKKELVQTILSMIEPMEKETGCISYSLFSNMEDKCHLNLLQEWRTRRYLDQYLVSDMFGFLLGTKSLLNEPHEINIYTIHQSEGMEAVFEARGKQRVHNHTVAPPLLNKD